MTRISSRHDSGVGDILAGNCGDHRESLVAAIACTLKATLFLQAGHVCQ